MTVLNNDQLEQWFYLTGEPKQDAVCSIPAADFIQGDNALGLLNTYLPLIKAHDIDVAAMYFISWFSHLALAQQYAVSCRNQAWDLSLDNITIQLYMPGQYARLSFQWGSWTERTAPEDPGERSVWLQRSLTDLYGNTFRPVIETVARAGKVDARQLWGQWPTRFYYFMNRLRAEIAEASVLERLEADYRYLVQNLPADVFGRPQNPLNVKPRLIEDLRDPNKQVAMKNVCCLYYKTEGGNYCYTCPRIKEQERAERREKVRAEAAANIQQ